MIVIASKEEKEIIKRLRSLDAVNIETIPGLTAEAVQLKKTIADLEIQRSKKQEQYDKQERELRHMIGLEKKRQEFEIEQAKGEATLKVGQDNLAAERKRFEEQLKFNTERFTTMEQTMKELLGDILQRIPNVNLELGRTIRKK